MATGTHTYFDHPAEPSANEPGFYWACRFNDLLKTFSYRPLNLYYNGDYNNIGEPYTMAEVCPEDNTEKCPKLTKPENIIGLQGLLWTDAMRSPAMAFGQGKQVFQ